MEPFYVLELKIRVLEEEKMKIVHSIDSLHTTSTLC
jgi:hypothetical protein